MAKRAVVLAGGELHQPEQAQLLLFPDDVIIAADGGARHSDALGVTPSILIGDLDSIQPALLAEMRQQGVEVKAYPTEKDETDLELALLYARDAGFEDVLVLGGTGSRWDQTLASVLLPAHPALKGIAILFWDGGQRLFVINGERQIGGEPGELISLIPVGGDAFGVHTEGLAYPLKGETLIFGATRGVSNVLLAKRATVRVAQGLLLCVVGARDEDDD
jgi:thiamine pyrophosphokinase